MKKMTGVALGVAIIVVGMASGSTSSLTDRKSARQFLSEATTYLRMRELRRVQARVAVQQFIVHVEATCPHVLADDVTRGMRSAAAARETFLHMAVDDLILAGDTQSRTPALMFASDLRHLRWSRPAVTRAVADFSQSLIATLALHPPGFCSDAKKSAATGFVVVPGDATRFVAGFDSAVKADMGHTVGQLANTMGAFLARKERDEVAQVRGLESRVDALLEIGEATLSRLHRAVVGS